MFCKTSVVAAALLGASLVKGHAIMVNPVPYNFKSWDNSPILEDGSNFPCKETDYTVTTENYLAKGQTHHVEFQGGATHGGGSCQISITSDRAPTKDSQWSVIKSIEGGCMDPNEGGSNLGNSASMKTPFSPGFTIPDSFEPGEYTLAWTWFNRIGNREMYMNCAPITVTGGSSKRSDVSVVEKRQTEEFPPLFIANINGCKLLESKSVRFPNPGSDVESLNEASLLAEGTDVCNEGSPTWGDAGYSSGSGSAPQPTASEPAATSSTEPTTSAPSVSVGVTVAVPDFTPTTAPEPVTTQPAETQSTEPSVALPTTSFQSVAPAPTSAPSPSTPSTSGALSGPCTEEGVWHCIGGSSFQRCASGNWTEVQGLASGTECIPGQNKDFTVKAIEIKSRMLREKRARRLAHGHANIHS